MSKRILIQLFIGIMIMFGIFSLFNSFLAHSKISKFEASYSEASIENYHLRLENEKLRNSLKETRERLNECLGKTMEEGEAE